MTAPAGVTPAKILVAVHGIGDQIGYETAQSVARQVGAFYDVATAIPLGRFYTGVGATNNAVPMPFLVTDADNKALLEKARFDIGFAEVYWASIPRQVVADGHILEESKKWAKTVASRLAQRAEGQGRPIPPREQIRLTTVLDEMIETVAVIERLNFVLAKAGVFKFNLNKLLTDFLGDVQIVVDFQAYREQILNAFSNVMDAALQLGKEGQPRELYLIGHSEGSVITFLAILKALADPDKHPWIRSVRGVMTIGSPIEVHHLLWPDLWKDLRPDARLKHAGQTIAWQNYYDFGDPIAYQLTNTCKWLEKTSFDQILKLEEVEYARSYLPGKAHVDYWSDNAVFAHFVDGVLCAGSTRHGDARPAPKPKSKWLAVAVSYTVPKLLVLALMCAATYVLYRPVAAAIITTPPDSTYVFYDVLGIGLLLLGVTAAARLPRLTNMWRWWIVSGACLLLSMFAYEWLVNPYTQESIGGHFPALGLSPTRGVQVVAALVAILAGILASWFPAWGTRILPISGLVAVGALMGDLVLLKHENNELWPVVLGGAVFFYLWRITALVFDLVFVWHRYVRHAAALASIAEVCEEGYKGSVLERRWTGVAGKPVAAHVASKSS